MEKLRWGRENLPRFLAERQGSTSTANMREERKNLGGPEKGTGKVRLDNESLVQKGGQRPLSGRRRPSQACRRAVLTGKKKQTGGARKAETSSRGKKKFRPPAPQEGAKVGFLHKKRTLANRGNRDFIKGVTNAGIVSLWGENGVQGEREVVVRPSTTKGVLHEGKELYATFLPEGHPKAPEFILFKGEKKKGKSLNKVVRKLRTRKRHVAESLKCTEKKGTAP